MIASMIVSMTEAIAPAIDVGLQATFVVTATIAMTTAVVVLLLVIDGVVLVLDLHPGTEAAVLVDGITTTTAAVAETTMIAVELAAAGPEVQGEEVLGDTMEAIPVEVPGATKEDVAAARKPTEAAAAPNVTIDPATAGAGSEDQTVVLIGIVDTVLELWVSDFAVEIN